MGLIRAYKIGAKTPTTAYIPLPREIEDVREKVLGMRDLSDDAMGIVDGTRSVARFVTGEKQGTFRGYYGVGADSEVVRKTAAMEPARELPFPMQIPPLPSMRAPVLTENALPTRIP